MQQDLIWLSISLFCNKKNWHVLLSNGIAGFTSSAKQLVGYSIEFNYLSGENVRLALLVNKNDAHVVSQNADMYFRDYFLSSKFTIKPLKLPVEGVFMPFPANTVQYGLYPPQSITHDELEKYQITIDLSEIIIAALEDEIDDEIILTFALYLHVGLIRSVYNYLDSVDELFLIINDVDYKIDESLAASYELAIEITNDVMQSQNFDPEINWMNSWTKQCEEALQKLNYDGDKNIKIRQFYINRISVINRKLGINVNSKKILDQLIGQSLRQYFIVNN